MILLNYMLNNTSKISTDIFKYDQKLFFQSTVLDFKMRNNRNKCVTQTHI